MSKCSFPLEIVSELNNYVDSKSSYAMDHLNDAARPHCNTDRKDCMNHIRHFFCREFLLKNDLCPHTPPLANVPKKFLNPETCNKMKFLPWQDTSIPRIAFFYEVYKSISMLARSIAALHHPNHYFLLQLDLDSEQGTQNEILKVANSYENVCVSIHGYVVYRGGGIAWSAISGIQWMTTLPDWTHFLTLSAQDYPVVSPRQFHQFFAHYANFSILKSFIPLSPGGMYEFRKHKMLLDWNHILLYTTDNMEYYLEKTGVIYATSGGFANALTKEFCEYLTSNGTAIQIARAFRYLTNSDESLFHTVLFNSKFKNRILNNTAELNIDHFCFMSWREGLNNDWKNDIMVDRYWNDFAKKGYVLARKFENSNDAARALLNRIDRELRNVTMMI